METLQEKGWKHHKFYPQELLSAHGIFTCSNTHLFYVSKTTALRHELNKRTEKCFVNLNEFLSILKFLVLAKYCSWFRNESGTKPLLFLGNVNQ